MLAFSATSLAMIHVEPRCQSSALPTELLGHFKQKPSKTLAQDKMPRFFFYGAILAQRSFIGNKSQAYNRAHEGGNSALDIPGRVFFQRIPMENSFPPLYLPSAAPTKRPYRPGRIEQATIQYFSSCMSCAFPMVFPFRLKLPLRSP
jgi:hypothetical protein